MNRQGPKFYNKCGVPSFVAAALLALVLDVSPLAAEPISVSEPASEQRVFSVRCRLQVSGNIETSSQPVAAAGQKPDEKKPTGLKLNVDGKFSFL